MAKKYDINPYLVVLLRRMLEYEFVRMKAEPSMSKLASLIYDKHKSEKLQLTKFTDKKGRDSFAASIAERIYTHFLKAKGYKFSFEHLNHVVAELHGIAAFASWAEFDSRYSDSNSARACKRKYLGREELTEDELQDVISQANRTLYKLHFARLREDHPHPHEVILNDEVQEFIIRTANTEEIKQIELLAKRVYPCPINSFEVKRPWHEKNKNIFFIYKDSDDAGDLWANINLLPLKREFYQLLKSGHIYENRISADDIYSLAERESVDCIYIEGLACTLLRVLPLFAESLPKMISALANVGNDNLTICAIGGSIEGDLLMRNCGFERTGWAVDPKDKKQYPFLELSWGELKKNLAAAHSSFYLINVDEDRLTKLL